MRKLVTKQEREKKQKKNQIILGIILVVVMIFGTLGYAIQGLGTGNTDTGSENGNILNYNGLQFEFINGFWVFGNFVFRYNPNEVPNIGSGLNPISSYRSKPVYFYSENIEASNEIQVNIGSVAESIQEACPPGEQCNANLQTKTCADNFIIIKTSSVSDIRQEENCVYIEGPSADLVRLTDQFLYKILGVK